MASEPRDRSAPAPFDFAQGVVSIVEPRSGARPFDRLRVALSDVEGRESVWGSPRGEAPRTR